MGYVLFRVLLFQLEFFSLSTKKTELIKEQCNQKTRETISSLIVNCEFSFSLGTLLGLSPSHLLTFPEHLPFNLLSLSSLLLDMKQEAPKQTLYTQSVIVRVADMPVILSADGREQSKKGNQETSRETQGENSQKRIRIEGKEIEPNQDFLCCLTRLQWPGK